MGKLSLIEIGMLLALVLVLRGEGSWLNAPWLFASEARSAAEPAAPATVELDDVRDIVVASGRVWVATQGGLAVYRRDDGSLSFTLGAEHGLSDDNLSLVARVDDNHLLVAGREGAVILGNLGGAMPATSAPMAITVSQVQGLSGKDPLLGVINSDGRRYLVQQRRGLVALNGHQGRWSVGESAAPVGMWSAASASPLDREGGGEILLGALDGTVARYPSTPRRRVTQFDDGANWHRSFDFPVLGMGHVGDEIVMATGESLLSLHDGSLRRIDTEGSTSLPAAVVSPADVGVLVGTVDGRVFQYRGRDLDLLTRAEQRITALEWDGDRVWIGVRHRGLHVVPVPPAWSGSQASLHVNRPAIDPNPARRM